MLNIVTQLVSDIFSLVFYVLIPLSVFTLLFHVPFFASSKPLGKGSEPPAPGFTWRTAFLWCTCRHFGDAFQKIQTILNFWAFSKTSATVLWLSESLRSGCLLWNQPFPSSAGDPTVRLCGLVEWGCWYARIWPTLQRTANLSLLRQLAGELRFRFVLEANEALWFPNTSCYSCSPAA